MHLGHLKSFLTWIKTTIKKKFQKTELQKRKRKYPVALVSGIHPEQVEPASPIELTTSWAKAPHTRRSCARSLEKFAQSFVHRAHTERGSRYSLRVVAHVFCWPRAYFRHERGSVRFDDVIFCRLHPFPFVSSINSTLRQPLFSHRPPRPTIPLGVTAPSMCWHFFGTSPR